MQHLPKNIRIVENGTGRFWAQKKCLFWWRDYTYAGTYVPYAPVFRTLSEACEDVVRELRWQKNLKEYSRRASTIVGKHRC